MFFKKISDSCIWPENICCFRVHSADHYLQEAKKLKHNADALVRLSATGIFTYETEMSVAACKKVTEWTISFVSCNSVLTHVRAALPHRTIALILAQNLNKMILLLLITSMMASIYLEVR